MTSRHQDNDNRILGTTTTNNAILETSFLHFQWTCLPLLLSSHSPKIQINFGKFLSILVMGSCQILPRTAVGQEQARRQNSVLSWEILPQQRKRKKDQHPGLFPFSTFPDLELSNSQKFAESENKIAKCEHTFSNRGSLFSSLRTLFSSRGNFVRYAKKKSAFAS